ncbi:hypothetical protein NPIL_125641 [Nephila pilipes]|uniref:Uncharacterized protein n=1 Tax=Nephila pilipes TaxID=299642 RepID=A0A8X6NWH6_NEPPI|nr:hypothetical protein NPIL_125641 [Nephila pilipes]
MVELSCFPLTVDLNCFHPADEFSCFHHAVVLVSVFNAQVVVELSCFPSFNFFFRGAELNCTPTVAELSCFIESWLTHYICNQREQIPIYLVSAFLISSLQDSD